MAPHSKALQELSLIKNKIDIKSHRSTHSRDIIWGHGDICNSSFSDSVVVAIIIFVAAGVLPGDATFAEEFFETMDNIFVYLYSIVVHLCDYSGTVRYAITTSSEHGKFLRSRLPWFSS